MLNDSWKHAFKTSIASPHCSSAVNKSSPSSSEMSTSSESKGAAGLARQYLFEFKDACNSLQLRYSKLVGDFQQQLHQIDGKLQSAASKVKCKRAAMIRSLQDMGPVDASMSTKLLAVFSWIGVLQLGYLVSSAVFAPILNPLLGLVLGRFTAALFASVLVPLLAFLQISHSSAARTDSENRFRLLQWALIEGLLMGYVFANRRIVSMEPLAFLSPLFVGLVGHVALSSGVVQQRISFLSVTLGLSLFAQLLVVVLFGQISVPCVLLASMYTMVSYCTLQVYFKHQTAPDYSTQMDYVFMLAFFVAAIYCEGLVLVLLGSSKSAVGDAHMA